MGRYLFYVCWLSTLVGFKMIQRIKDIYAKWAFVAAVIGVVIFWILYQRRGRSIIELKAEAEKQVLAIKLKEVLTKAGQSQEDFNNAIQDWNNVRRRHADIFARIGIGATKPSSEGDGSVNRNSEKLH